MTAINGTWRINANGSGGLLMFETRDNVTLNGSVTFDDTGGRTDRVEGKWNENARQITFTRFLPGDSVKQVFTGNLGNNLPEDLILAGNFTESDVPSGVHRSQFGWAAAPLLQAATYSLKLDRFHVNQTRDTISLPEFKGRDIIYASLATQILTQVGYGEILPVSHKIGPVHNGEDHPTNLEFVIRLQPNEELVFSYLLVNRGSLGSGAHEVQKFLNDLSGVTKSALDVIYPAEKAIWEVADQLTRTLNSIIGSGCDGIVAGDKIRKTASELNQLMPTSGKSFTERREYRYSSPIPCQHPDYVVFSTFTRQ